jgi:hypothetical protein
MTSFINGTLHQEGHTTGKQLQYNIYSCGVQMHACILQNTYPSTLLQLSPRWIRRPSPHTGNSHKEGHAKSEYVVLHWQDTLFYMFWRYKSPEWLLIKIIHRERRTKEKKYIKRIMHVRTRGSLCDCVGEWCLTLCLQGSQSSRQHHPTL